MKNNLLSYKDSWYVYTFYVDGKEISQLKEVEIAGMKYKVYSRQVSISYSDHGHIYDGTSRHYFINTFIGDAEIEVSLTDILDTRQEPVYALKFKYV